MRLVIQDAIDRDVIFKKGAWFSFKGLSFQGMSKLREHFKNNPSDLEELKNE